MGYKFQFVTLAGFHALNYSMFQLAPGCRDRRMEACAELQEAEFAAEKQGYSATKHQHEVVAGMGYFDDDNQIIAAGHVLHGGDARFNRTRTVSLKRAETASSAAAALTDSRLAALCAEEARNAFRDYMARFDEITQRARDRFLARDWHGSYDDAAERLHLYSRVLDGLTNRVESLLGARLRERSVWQATKAVYSSLIAQSIRWEIGESFFNSLTRRVFATEGVDQAIEFVDTDFDAPPTEHDAELCRAFTGAALPDLISSALTDVDSGFATDRWRDLDRVSAAAAERILSGIVQQKDATLEIFRGVFYRGRGAYLVGRITAGGKADPGGVFSASSG